MNLRKRVIIALSVAIAVPLLALTIVSYYRYQDNIPIVSIASPKPNLENATYANYTELSLPLECLEAGSIYILRNRNGLFADETYVETEDNLQVIRTDENYIYIAIGVILPDDKVVLSTSLPLKNGDIVKVVQEFEG